MEFTREMGLLQSAIQLVGKNYPAAIKGPDPSTSSKADAHLAQKIINHAINEVLRGITSRNSPKQQLQWKERLTELMVCLSGLVPKKSELAKNWEHIISSFPRIHCDLCLALIIMHSWTQQFMKCLFENPADVSLPVLQGMCHYITTLPHLDERHIKFLGCLWSFLFVYSQPLIFSEDTVESSDNKKELDQSSSATKENSIENIVGDVLSATKKALCDSHIPDNLHVHSLTPLFMALISIIRTRNAHSVTFIKSGQLFAYDLSEHLSNKVTFCEYVDVENPKFLMKWQSEEGKEMASLEDMPVSVVTLHPHTSRLLVAHQEDVCDIATAVFKMVKQRWTMKEVLDNFSTLQGESLPHTVVCHLWLKIVEEAINIVQANEGAFDEDIVPLLESVRVELQSMIAGLGTPDQLAQAVTIIGSKLKTFKEWCNWLLTTKDNKIRKDPRWLQCVQDNHQCFAHENFAMQMLKHLQENKLPGECRPQLEKVTLQILTALDFVNLCRVLHSICADPSLQGLLPPSVSFSSQLTTSFNMLVADSSHEESSFKEDLKSLCILAVQDPDAVLKRVICEASSTAAQAKLMAMVLGELNGLTELGKPESCQPLILSYLSEELAAQANQQKPWQYLNMFISSLLQKEDSTQQKLVDKNLLLKVCVLPHLSNEKSQSGPSLHQALELIQMVLDYVSEDNYRLEEYIIFPLKSSLANIVDECQNLWNHGCSPSIKQMALTCIETLTKILSGSSYADIFKNPGGYWLTQQIKKHHWITRAYMSLVLLKGDMPLPLPVCLKNVQGTLPLPIELQSCSCPSTLALLELCKSCDQACELLCQDCCPKEKMSPQVILSLVQILPHSIQEEWSRLWKVILKLLQSSSPTNSEMLHPDANSELKCSWVFIQSILMLIQNKTAELSMSHPVWKHVTQCLVATLKDYIPMWKEARVSTQLLQLFTQLCVLLQQLPESSREPVCVLCMEILRTLQEELVPLDGDIGIAEAKAAVRLISEESSKDMMVKLLEGIAEPLPVSA